MNAWQHGRATPAPPWAGTRCGPRCCRAGSQPPQGAAPSSTLPPALRRAPTRLSPAIGTEALWVFIGISGAQLCRFDSSCASCCAAGMEGGWQPLGALSSFSPAPSPPHSSCPCSSPPSHHPDPLPGSAAWSGHVAAQGRRAGAVGTPHLWHPVQTWGCSPMELGLQSPFPNQGPSSIGPRLWESPAAWRGDATPWDGQPSPAPSAPVPGTGPTWSAVPAGHGAGLLPRLCHQDFSIHPTPHSGTRRGHEVLPHLGIGLHTLTDRR